MIVSAALCPCPPLLFRELSGGTDVAADLRGACEKAVHGLVDGEPDVVVVLGAAATSRTWAADGVGLGSFGLPGGALSRTPLSLRVAQRLLTTVGWTGATELRSLVWDASVGDLEEYAADLADRPDRVALLAMGDAGTPGAGGTPTDLGLPGVLPSLGGPAAVVEALRRQDAVATTGTLLYADDPFGVMYVVASWALDGSAPG